MKSVYVVNLNAWDYSSLEEKGELIFMTKGILDLRKINDYESKMYNFIKDSKEDDYLAFSGPSLACSVALKIWLDIHPFCNVLTFSRNNYDLHTISR